MATRRTLTATPAPRSSATPAPQPASASNTVTPMRPSQKAAAAQKAAAKAPAAGTNRNARTGRGMEIVTGNLVKGSLPQVRGRGRAPIPLDEETRQKFLETLGVDAIQEFWMPESELSKLRNKAKKWEKECATATDTEPIFVKVHFRNLEEGYYTESGEESEKGEPGAIHWIGGVYKAEFDAAAEAANA